MQQGPDPEDAHLVRLICQDDPEAAGVLLHRCGGRVHGHLRRRFPSLDDSDIHDILVDALLRLLETFDPQRGSPGPWLLFLAHRAAVDRIRASSARQKTVRFAADQEVEDLSGDPVDALLWAERREQIALAVQALPGLERAVMEADLEAESAAPAAQLAKQLNTTEGSIYTARQRARQKLAAAFRGEFPQADTRRTDHGPTS